MNKFERGLNPKVAMGIGYAEQIKKICEGIANTYSIFFDDPNGPYSMKCPFCDAEIQYGGGVKDPTMEDLPHTEECIYLIAKDLYEKIK